MKPLRKVQAGGIIRTSLDNTWRTPRYIRDAAETYFEGRIPFDPATGLENPMRALRFCAGPLDVVMPLTKKLPDGSMWVEPEEETRERGLERRRGLLQGLARGLELGVPVRATVDGRPVRAWLEVLAAERERAMPFVSGLEVAWDWPVWVNPPYGRELRPWLVKITKEAHRGAEIVGLLPCARWEQTYFHRALRAARHECLIRGRVAFISSIDGSPVGGNPYASMLIGWNTSPERWLRAFGAIGMCSERRPIRRRVPVVEVLGDGSPMFGEPRLAGAGREALVLEHAAVEVEAGVLATLDARREEAR